MITKIEVVRVNKGMIKEENALMENDRKLKKCIYKISKEIYSLPNEYEEIKDDSIINSIAILFQVADELCKSTHLELFTLKYYKSEFLNKMLFIKYGEKFKFHTKTLDSLRDIFIHKLEILGCENIEDYLHICLPNQRNKVKSKNKYKKITEDTRRYLRVDHKDIFNEILKDYILYIEREDSYYDGI